MRSKCPDDEQQKFQTEYWEDYDTHKARSETSNVEKQEQEETGNEQLLDALFTRPCHAIVFASICNNTVRHMAPQAPVVLQVTCPGKWTDMESFGCLCADVFHKDYDTEVSVSSDDTDGEFKENNKHFYSGSQPCSDFSDDFLAESVPVKSSLPHGIDDWDDNNLLNLWKWKTIRKKGYEPMMAHFQGQTVNTLVETWNTHKKRCEELGAAWRKAGKPMANVAE